MPGVIPVAADLLDLPSLRERIHALPVSHVFYSTWLRQPSEAENVAVNGAMMRNLFAALQRSHMLQHVSLVTGTKHYLGPFESYGQTVAETPFREDNPRLPGENFYYTQEDILFEAADRMGFHWNVFRPHTMIGYTLGNAMNMGVTLAVYATICRETGRPFVFPGSIFQWNALTDVTDATMLAREMEWAATHAPAHDQALNAVNGDIFRWRWLWGKLAEWFGVTPQGPLPGEKQPLEAQQAELSTAWTRIAQDHDLAVKQVDKLASWWHTDADLGREVECVNDMTRSRLLGFTEYRSTLASFVNLFERLERDRILPRRSTR